VPWLWRMRLLLVLLVGEVEVGGGWVFLYLWCGVWWVGLSAADADVICVDGLL
jgi:hypothetical protein